MEIEDEHFCTSQPDFIEKELELLVPNNVREDTKMGYVDKI